jgi:hypothetical protein
MDAMDQYLARLGDPAVRSFNRKLNGIDEGDPEPVLLEVSEAHIKAAEDELGLALPPSYRKLVTTAQPFDAEYGLYWISEIAWGNRGPDARFPQFVIPFLGCDNGDEYGFDTRHPDERGEYPIVLLDHEIHGADSTDFEPVARDLGEFLLGSLGGREPLT